MSRLSDTLAACRADGTPAMGLFTTNGFPTPEATVPILHAIDAGGADFIELGMPFSDPLAEGLPIQRSSARALSHGVTMDDAFDTVATFREESDTPVLLMGYINPVLQYGMDTFCTRAAEAGVDGLILPDVPPEEAEVLTEHAQAAGLDLVFLIAPNSSDARIQRVDELATGFVYAVSVTGLTGSRLDGRGAVQSYLKRARSLVTQNPLLVGFGIATHDDAMELSQHTDGFIVGSALIQEIEACWDDDTLSDEERYSRIRQFARALKEGPVLAGSNPEA